MRNLAFCSIYNVHTLFLNLQKSCLPYIGWCTPQTRYRLRSTIRRPVLLQENHHREYITLSVTFRRLIVYVKLMAGVLKCYVFFFS